VLRRLPEAAAFALADVVARLAHRFAGATRARVRANLSRVVPPGHLEATVAAAFRSYARYWVESFRAADLDPADVDARTSEDGFEHVDAVLDQGRGIIVLLAHHGSWDIAARWAETHGYHLAVVAEVLRPRALFERFVGLREAMGLEVVPYQARRRNGAADRDGAGPLFKRLGQVLADNHMVGLLSDRDLSGRAPAVTFFGEPTSLPQGPVLLSKRTGATIVPVTVLQRPGRRWHVQALPPLDITDLGVAEACEVVARALEDLVRLDPTQWHAFQPQWPATASGDGQRS
jgi:KDO2-lipid IV(A) lauroyltransferase